jgi:Autotransporter beta-domain
MSVTAPKWYGRRGGSFESDRPALDLNLDQTGLRWYEMVGLVGTGQVFGDVGYGLAFAQIAVERFAGLAWVHLRTDSFAETGGVTALTGANSNGDVGYSTVGLRVATSYMLQIGTALIPCPSAAWEHGFGDIAPAAVLAFQSTGAGFAITGVPLARDAALIEAGLDLRVTPGQARSLILQRVRRALAGSRRQGHFHLEFFGGSALRSAVRGTPPS